MQQITNLLFLPHVLVIFTKQMPNTKEIRWLDVLQLPLLGRELVKPHTLNELLCTLLNMVRQLVHRSVSFLNKFPHPGIKWFFQFIRAFFEDLVDIPLNQVELLLQSLALPPLGLEVHILTLFQVPWIRDG